MELNRREFFKASVGFVAMSADLGNNSVNMLPNASDEKSNFIATYKKLGGFNTLGYRLSDPWTDQNGLVNVAFQQGFLQKGPDGGISLRNILDDISNMGLDQVLSSGKYGVIVPPTRTLSPDDFSNLPRTILNAASDLASKGADPGNPTSPYVDYGAFKIVRFQKMALQMWNNDRVDRVLIGNAAEQMDIIPPSALLKIPTTDQPATPLGSCQSGRSWEGMASYYSRAGCLGCSGDFRMANGDPLDDSKLTLAFMRLPLNTLVQVTNTSSGESTQATVTDRGGFEAYGRIADLSLALRNRLGGLDMTPVTVTELVCVN